MSSILTKYFLHIKALVTVDEAELGHRSQLILKRLEMEQLPPKLTQMNAVLHANLTKLYIQYNSLSSLPETLGDILPRLRVLCLDYNRLSKLPSTLTKMSQLRMLNISHNPLRSIPDVVYSLQNLHELWANSIGISWELSPEICKLVKLRVLGLRNNGINRLPMNFSELKSLVRVSLSENLFHSIPFTLLDLPTLVHLNMDNNEVAELPSGEMFMKAQELRYIRLRNNSFNVTPEVCNKLTKVAKLKWCLLDGNFHEGSPSKIFKGFFKPAPRVRSHSSTSSSQFEENNTGINNEHVIVLPNNENPTPTDVELPFATAFTNLHVNSCTSSQCHRNRGQSDNQHDENIKSAHGNSDWHNNRPKSEQFEETSDGETTWSWNQDTDSSSEYCTTFQNTEAHNIPLRIIEVDISSGLPTLDKDTWEQLSFTFFQKSSHLLLDAPSTEKAPSSTTITSGRVDKDLTNHQDRLLCGESQAGTEMITNSLAVASHRTSPIFQTPEQSLSRSSIRGEEQSRISQTFPVGGQHEFETQLRFGALSESARHFSDSTGEITSLPQNKTSEIADWLVEVMKKAGQHGLDTALNCSMCQNTVTYSKFSPNCCSVVCWLHFNTAEKANPLLLPCFHSQQNNEPPCFTLSSTKSNAVEKHYQDPQISCSTANEITPLTMSENLCETNWCTEQMKLDINDESHSMRAAEELRRCGTSCESSASYVQSQNLSEKARLQQNRVWNSRCCPMERVKEWIKSTTSSSTPTCGEIMMDQLPVGGKTCATFHEIKSNTRLTSILTNDENKNDPYEQGSINISTIHSNNIIELKQSRRKHIHFSDKNSYVGSPQQSMERVEEVEAEDQVTLHAGSSLTSLTIPSHSLEIIFESQNPPDMQSSVWTSSAILNLNNNNFRSDLNHSPSEMSHVLQDFWIPDEANANQFSVNNALELDNSDLEYSPRSSDIDDYEDISELDDWDWEDFALENEDITIILKSLVGFNIYDGN